MKKQIAIAMGLAVLSTPVLASKARLEALGEDANGSMFISDSRNIFLNAASVNFHKDMVTMEWGSDEAVEDEAATPRAEGGFLKAMGNMVYGLHFGNASDTSNDFRSTAGVDVAETNVIDFFIGGDAGIQWGASLTYTDTTDEEFNDTAVEKDEQSAMRVRLGAVSGNIAAFANVNLSNEAKSEADDTEFEGKSGYDLGVTYNMNDVHYMVRYQALTGEDKKRTSDEEISTSATRLGVAKEYRLNDRSNFWVSAWYNMMERDEFGVETTANFLPVTLATEVEVKDWLVLRGSVSHIVHGTAEVKAAGQTVEGSLSETLVNAGASLVFGDFQIDGLIGNGTDGAGVLNGTENGTLSTDTLLSRVSMTYRF